MNGQAAVVAVAMIGVGMFGLILMIVYATVQINKSHPAPARQTRRRDADLVVEHRFKHKKRGKMRPAQTSVPDRPVMPLIPAPDMQRINDDDSRWQRPGFAAPARAAQERAPLPYYEPNAPRHVFVPRQTSMPIVPREIVGPEQKPPRLSQRTQRSQRTAFIKSIRVETEQPAQIVAGRGRFDMAI